MSAFCRNSQNKQYAPYGVIRTALMGFLHESLNNCGAALEQYARGGALVDQRRLMFCLVQQFLTHTDKLQFMKTQSEPSSPATAGGGGPHQHMPNPLFALNHLLASYKRQSEHAGANSVPPVMQFLEGAKTISPLVGMQAYRLMLELIYRDLLCQLDLVAAKDPNGQLHKDLELGSFRTFPGSHRNVGTAHQASARNR